MMILLAQGGRSITIRSKKSTKIYSEFIRGSEPWIYNEIMKWNETYSKWRQDTLSIEQAKRR